MLLTVHTIRASGKFQVQNVLYFVFQTCLVIAEYLTLAKRFQIKLLIDIIVALSQPKYFIIAIFPVLTMALGPWNDCIRQIKQKCF